MLSYKLYRDALVTTTNGNDELLNQFDSSYRSAISSLDMQTLMDGLIPQRTLLNILANSLKITSHKALEMYQSTNDLHWKFISNQIWNPMIEVTLQSTIRYVSANTIEKKSSSSTSSPKIHKIGSLSNAFEHLALSVSQIDDIRKQLLAYGDSVKRPFSNRFHRHIVCANDDCQFCRDLYNSVNITRCINHKPCHRTGYYPHIGTSLWAMIKNKHGKDGCRLSAKPCKEGEIPSLNTRCDVELTSTPGTSSGQASRSWADEVEDEISSGSSTQRKEAVIYPNVTVQKRRRTNE